MSRKPFVIGISGGTCSGKSTLAQTIEESLAGKHRIVTLHLDSYYNWSAMTTTSPLTGIEYSEHNHPAAVNTDRIYSDLSAAISDERNDILLVEGLFALYFEPLREKMDLKIYVDLRSDERLYRRVKRNMVREEPDSIAIRYLDTVRYRHDEFVEPTRWYADLVINGTLDLHKGAAVVLSYIDTQI